MRVEYWLTPYKWIKDTGLEHWAIPNCKGCIDLRTLPQQAEAGGVPGGYGIAVFDTPQRLEGLKLGADELITKKSTIDSILNLPRGTIAANTPKEIIAELLINHGDPTGQIRWKPLRAGFQKGIEINLNGKFWRQPLVSGDQTFLNSLAVFKEDYKRNRAMLDSMVNADAHFEALRRYTGATLRKYRLSDSDQILPDEFKSDRSLQPKTAIGDTFVDTNGTALTSHTATGTGGGFSWTAIDTQVIDIEGNQADSVGGDSTLADVSIAGTALSSDDQTVKATVITMGGSAECGMTALQDGGATQTHYLGDVENNTQTLRLFKRITGTFTALATAESVTISLPNDIQLDVTGGSTEDCSFNSVTINGTDTAITGNLHAGFRLRERFNTDQTTCDTWTASDLAAGVTLPIFRNHYRMMQTR